MVVGAKALGASLGEATTGADLGSSKYDNFDSFYSLTGGCSLEELT